MIANYQKKTVERNYNFNTLKLIISLLFINFGYSQIYYSNYLDQTSEWRVLEHHGEASYHDLTFKTIFFDGFENINGYSYYKMYQTFYKIGYEYGYSSILFPQSSNSTQFIGYFREDPNGKFYLFNNGTLPIIFIGQLFNNGVETVFFDNQVVLNSQIGDLFTAYFSQSNCNIDYVGNIIFNGINLKQIKCDTNGMVSVPGTANCIEGIGYINNSCYNTSIQDNSLMYFERMYFYSKQGQNITFYDNLYVPYGTNNGLLYYYSFANADRQILSISTKEKDIITIYPNPTNSVINISSNNQIINSISISDTQGRLIKTEKCFSTELKLDISNLQTGTYFVKIETNIETFSKKIIKN